MYTRHPEYRSVSADRMADAVCRAGDEPGGWLVPHRDPDWQPVVFWALAYSAVLATALAWEFMAVCVA